jgi:LysM repeat protein
MAEETEAAGVKNLFTRKIGPLPVGVWAIAGVGIWWFVSKKKTAASATSSTTATGTPQGTEPGTEGTDPAGNTGLLDPSTGYVYGTPEDLAALDQNNPSGSSDSSGSSSSSGQTYTTNQAWESAAINYLVGIGDDATLSNSSISQYLASQPLTTEQQAMVNSAILALGAPPQPPTPTTTTPVVTPPGGGGPYATNPVTGLASTNVTATSIGLKWNAATGAQGYTVGATASGKAATTQSTSQPSITLSGLTPQTAYAISVQATPADAGAGKATTTVTTAYGVSGPPTGGPNPTGAPVSLTPGQVISVPVMLTPQKNLATAAKQYGDSVAHLQQFNPGLSATADSGTVNFPVLVKSGDTLNSIAAKFQISPEHLAQDLQAEGVV